MPDLVVVEHDTVVVVQEIGTQVVEVVSAGPQGIPGPGTWAGISDKPTVIAAGATQAEARTTIGAVADNDARLADQRTPTGGAGGVLSGAYPNPGFAVDMATQADLDAAIAQRIPMTQRGAANGVASLDAGGKVPESQIPAIAITDVFPVASQASMLALTAERGDVAVRSDINRSFALAAEPASLLANWLELRTPTDVVLSVAGKTGAVVLEKADVGLGNVDNTADAAKPVSTAVQTALDAKQNSLGFTPIQQGGGTGQGANKIYVGWAADSSGLMAQVDATNFGTDWPINISKNAATATKLTTARTINGVSFDGSANISINAAAVPNTPAGTIVATTVQAAINELDAEKVSNFVALPINTDLDTVVTSGFYRMDEVSNGPVVAVRYGQLIVSRGFDTITQIAAGLSGRMFTRSGNPFSVGGGGAFTPWLEVYTSASILGTVIQSAGVPTGALIEQGSNSNGRYLRFADGTQICTWKTPAAALPAVSMPVGQIYRSTDIDILWTFPAAFSSEPAASGAVVAGIGNAWVGAPDFGINSATSCQFKLYAATPQPAGAIVQMIAIGRWF